MTGIKRLSNIQPYIQKLRELVQSIVSPELPEEALKEPAVRFDIKQSQLILASLAINILALGLPVMTLQIYDRILVSQNLGTVRVLAIGVVVVVILEVLLRMVRSYVINWASASYEHVITCNSMRHMLAADLSTLEQQGTGELLQRMGSVGKLREFYSGQALITIIELPFVLIFTALIAYLAGVLALVPITLLVIFGVLAKKQGEKLKRALSKRDLIDESRMDFIIETLSGIHTLKSLGGEAVFQRRYELLQNQNSIANYYVARENNIAANYGALFTQTMIISIVAFGASMAMQGSITLGSLIACVLLSGRIMQPIQRALFLWTRFQNFQLSLESVKETFELPVLDRIDENMMAGNEGYLDIRDLSFAYHPNEPLLFKHLELRLEPGECISISDHHGSGKTTLLKLMAGLYAPPQGFVLVDGTSATEYPSHELIRHVGYLAMEGAIFSGSIWDNLSAFGEIPEKNVHEMIIHMGLDKEITKLPEGFETHLEGSPSDPVAPGIKQRISIARALASKPRIILFDNADRSLDKEGYNQMYRLLARLKGKVSMVIVSDDRNILGLSDKEYTLHDGKLIDRDIGHDSKLYGVQPYRMLKL